MSTHHRTAATLASLSSPLPAALGLSFVAVLAGCSSSGSDSDGPDVTAPAVSSFVQDRAIDPTGQTIVVTFSEAVTAATAELAAAYTISNGVVVSSATLRSTGDVVDLVLDTAAIPGLNTISVGAGIEDAAGNASEAVTATALTSTDTTAPEASAIEGITVSGAENDMITVVFSDNLIQTDVEMIANWTVEAPEGTPFDITGATVSYDDMTRTATVTLGAGSADQNLQTFDDIHATFTGIRDLGGNTIEATTIGTTAVAGMVGGDTTPPTLTAAAPGTGNDLTLTFSETVTQLETADLRSSTNTTGTDIVLTDASDPGVAASGTIELLGTVLDGDSITIDDGATDVTFEFDYGATGSITLSGQPGDGDSVSVHDGTALTAFEFDTGDGVNASAVTVLIGLDLPETVSNLLTAINGAPSFTVTASAGAVAELNLRNDSTGAGGNQSSDESDLNNVITITPMAGGGVVSGNQTVAVNVTGIAGTVTLLRAEIDANGFNIATSDGDAPEDFVVTNTGSGDLGNQAITEDEAGTAISVSAMTGGVDPGSATLLPSASTGLLSDLQAVVTFSAAPEAADSIRIFGVTDLAGNQMLPVSAAAVVAADAAAPSFGTVPTVTVNSGEFNDEVIIGFDRDIQLAGSLDLANYEIAGTAMLDIENATATRTGTDEVTLRFGKGSGINLIAAQTYDVSIANLASLQAVVMNPETAVANLLFSDTTAPTIGATDARLDPNDSTAAIFTFSEAISEAGGSDIANYSLAGNATVSASFLTARVVRVVFTDDLEPADSVVISAAAVTDLGGTAATGVATVALAAADASVPTIDSVTTASGATDGRDTITVVFSEPIPTSQVTTAANFTITSGGAAVDLTGAELTESSVNDSVVIRLAEGVSLQTSDVFTLTPTGLTDTSGNAIVETAITLTVAGDAASPTVDGSFMNLLLEPGATIVEVDFSEGMNPATTTSTANWSGSAGQTASSVMQLTASRYRVTFSAAIGAMDTIDIAMPTDRAGNFAPSITVDPAE